MSTSKAIFLILALFLVFVAGCSKGAVEDRQDASIQDSSKAGVKEPELLAGSQAKYYVFDKDAYEKALSENKIVMLYFYANWCPICKVEQSATKAAFNELSNSNIVGFRVNYRDSDTDQYEEELAKTYGVSYQHTKVIIKDGERVLKAPDSWNKQKYLDELSKVA